MALALVAIWTGLQLLGLDAIPFHSKGEPREAIVVQDIVNADRYVLPLRNGFEIPRKPPLFYWLGALVAHAEGHVDEATARLPSALQSCAGSLLLLAVGVVAGSPLAGFLSALVLLTSFEWLRAAVSARIDMTLAFGTTASFAGFYLARRRPGIVPLLLLYGGMIWGTLAKGPIGILLPTLCAVVILILESGKRWIAPLLGLAVAALVATGLGAPPAIATALAGAAFALYFVYITWDDIRPLHPIAGFILVAAATLAWYALAARTAGEVFVNTFIAENFGRFLGNASISVGHRHGAGYLVGSFAGGFLPWTLFALFAAPSLLRHREADSRKLVTQSLVWVVVVFTFFTLSESKRGVYILPMYPAAACLVGIWLADVASRRPQPRLLWAIARSLATVLALLAGVIVIVFGLEVLGLDLRQAIVDPIVAGLAGATVAESLSTGFATNASRITAYAAGLWLCSITLLFTALRHQSRSMVAALFATVIALQVLTQQAIMPAVATSNDRAAFAQRLASLAGDRTIATAPDYDDALSFHLGGEVPVLDLNTEPPAEPYLVILKRHDWNRMTPLQRSRFEAVPGLSVPKQNNQYPLLVVQRVPRRAKAGGDSLRLDTVGN